MHPLSPIYCIVFHQSRRIAAGPVAEAAREAREQLGERAAETQVFDAETSKPIDIDWRGSADEVAERLSAAPGGIRCARARPAKARRRRARSHVAAAALGMAGRTAWRRVGHVAPARRSGAAGRCRRNAASRTGITAHRFMTAMAGDTSGFEEALRALYAGDAVRFAEHTSSWPVDVREHARVLAMPVLSATV